MNRSRASQPGKWLKRARQAAYVVLHAPDHVRCALAVKRSSLKGRQRASSKYLGDCFALSLTTAQRRHALVQHHWASSQTFPRAVASEISKGVTLWQRDIPNEAPLVLALEPAAIAPMEGELQFKFSYRSYLHVLTFLFAPGHLFGSDCRTVIFIGGVQGRVGCREEIRAAAKLNREIAPAAVLLLAAQALAEELETELLAVGEADQISMSYSPSMVRFDYEAFWTEMGGSRGARFYRLPLHSPQRPLSSIGLSHRARTRRKREEKFRIRAEIAASFRKLVTAASDVQPDVVSPEARETLIH